MTILIGVSVLIALCVIAVVAVTEPEGTYMVWTSIKSTVKSILRSTK